MASVLIPVVNKVVKTLLHLEASLCKVQFVLFLSFSRMDSRMATRLSLNASNPEAPNQTHSLPPNLSPQVLQILENGATQDGDTGFGLNTFLLHALHIQFLSPAYLPSCVVPSVYLFFSGPLPLPKVRLYHLQP